METPSQVLASAQEVPMPVLSRRHAAASIASFALLPLAARAQDGITGSQLLIGQSISLQGG